MTEIIKYTNTPTNYPMSVCLLVFCAARPGQLVAVRRRQNPARLCLAGGKIQDGETLLEALWRETFEELGIKLDLRLVRPLYANICEDDTNTQDYWNTTFYLEVSDPDMLFETLEEDLEPAWFTLEEFFARSAFPIYNKALIAQAQRLGIF